MGGHAWRFPAGPVPANPRRRGRRRVAREGAPEQGRTGSKAQGSAPAALRARLGVVGAERSRWGGETLQGPPGSRPRSPASARGDGVGPLLAPPSSLVIGNHLVGAGVPAVRARRVRRRTRPSTLLGPGPEVEGSDSVSDRSREAPSDLAARN